MKKLALSGRNVLITGAARGLGRQLAIYLATVEGANLVLVSRDAAGLNDLVEEINSCCSVKIRIMVKDLLPEHSAQSLYDELKDDDIFGLVNNAGMTYYGVTEASHIDLFRSIINLDFRLVVELSLLFLSRFKAQGEGFIVNVTSLASFIPIPYQAVYAAAKGAAQSFTECLYQENRGCPVIICTFAPSGIVTEMIHKSGLTLHMEMHRYFYLTPQRAARAVIRGLKRGKRVVIPGLINRLIYVFMNILPRSILVLLAGKIYNFEKYRKLEIGGD
jgi:short-subunit dehydrogenase